jgi:hypothetical protein
MVNVSINSVAVATVLMLAGDAVASTWINCCVAPAYAIASTTSTSAACDVSHLGPLSTCSY